MMDGLLEGRTVFITGGSRGIGRAVVKACIGHGADAGFTYLDSEVEARELVEEMGSKCSSFRADSSSLDDMDEALDSFAGEFGSIDGLVVNAGIYNRKSIHEMDPDDWKRTLDTNLTGAYNTVRAALNHMKSGSMVMVSSQLAFRGSASGSDYSASKAGMLGFSRSLARELAPSIRVNSVAPGYVDTDILARDSPEKRRKRIEEVPLGRIGRPDEIADPIIFLLSDLSSYTTGATLDINGGLFIH
jgi:3-oxoacyl-[acyl-carrier protein] reductase